MLELMALFVTFPLATRNMVFFLHRWVLTAGSNSDAPHKNVASCKVKDTIIKSPVTTSEGWYWRGGVRSARNHKRKGRVAGVSYLLYERVFKEN